MAEEAEAEAAEDAAGEALQEEKAGGRTLLASFALLLPMRTTDEQFRYMGDRWFLIIGMPTPVVGSQGSNGQALVGGTTPAGSTTSNTVDSQATTVGVANLTPQQVAEHRTNIANLTSNMQQTFQALMDAAQF